MENNIRYRLNEEGIAEVLFDPKEEKTAVLSEAVMRELEEIIGKIETEHSIKALLFKSAKPGIFLAGADINEISAIKTKEEASSKSMYGQDLLNRIENLPFPTVSVINGACLGGGLELVLATQFRIVTDSKKVQLGLPETTLGIIPGFGGTIRLPRLIGLSAALNLILSGKTVNGLKAYQAKLADAYYPEAFLEEKTVVFVKQILDPVKRKAVILRRKKRRFSQRFLDSSFPGRMLVFKAAKKEIIRKTKGFYPAPLEALQVIKKNLNKGQKKALEIERKSFSKLAVTEISKNLVNIFFVNESLKKAYHPDETAPIRKDPARLAGVLGAGKMGGGIAWLFSSQDINVRMKDISWEGISSGYKAIEENYRELQKIKKLDGREAGLKMHKVTGAVDYSGFSSAGVIIEAIIEDKEIKIKTLKELESITGNDAILATNTSSFSVEELSAGLMYPERFAGFHFFNPVNRMPLVEVVRGPKTSQHTIRKMIALARMLKKVPILVNDCRGFLVNRILMAYLNEALLIMEQGVDFSRIDRILVQFGFPLGPFTLMDEIGIKVAYKVAKNLVSAYPSRSEITEVFSEIGNSNRLSGKAAGTGFYLYRKGKKYPNMEITQILSKHGIHKNSSIPDEEILDRCLLKMINEAGFCLEEDIINRADYLDMALILGIGFPPFRGGLLKYADNRGIDDILAGMEKLEKQYGNRFHPGKKLIEMKNGKERFYL